MNGFGRWGPLVRELADYDVARYAEIYRWPASEALAAYQERLRREAREDYRNAVLIWATLAATGAIKQKRAPALPPILKD